MMVDEHTPILKIAVFADGRFTVDGVLSSVSSLRESLLQLNERHGAVCYYRESGQQEPPPVVAEILAELMAARPVAIPE